MGHTMALLVLIFIFLLQSEAGISEKYFYNRPGDDVILPCDSVSSSDTCSSVYWLFNRQQSHSILEVERGNVVMNSAQAARVRLDSNCSLLISNITAEDAGVYNCRQGKTSHVESSVFLNILTISPSPPDADQQRDDDVTLRCSLLKYRDLSLCEKNRIRWVDETEAELPGIQNDSVHHTVCVSVLKVKRHSGDNKKYTCQFVDERNSVMIQTDFTPFITGGRKPIHHSDEPEVNLTYITVSHDNQRASPERRVKQEENVTYSTIKTL
ncbi:uncharacterized protein LOC111231731 isoform X2 [Seriola dumerili]|uniref:uncharacterized protein LOC111231731 isoform X2 n=1 Tax=Seriola dumerili TaxID=41447 RepID=UPI000BBE87D1|nr:uncharacterized protein LOC111231731 isoform X2 [Seriola dumerili]